MMSVAEMGVIHGVGVAVVSIAEMGEIHGVGVAVVSISRWV